MKLGTKLMLAFLVFAFIGTSLLTLTSSINHKTVTSLMNDLKESNLDDVKTTNYIAEIIGVVDDLNLLQRTLLIPGLTQEVRDADYRRQDELRLRLEGTVGDLEAHWRTSSSNITRAAQEKWPEAREAMKAYLESIQELTGINRSIDATYIHDPKQLMRLQQEYRGNHFNVASRAGEVFANQKAVGQPLTFDESKCTLQKWRLGVINKELPYYRNDTIAKVVADIDAPHRLLHRIAEETYDKYAAGDADPEAILAEINLMMPAARKMNEYFQTVIGEAEKSQKLFEQAFHIASTKSITAGDSLAGTLEEINRRAIEMSATKATNAVAEGESSIDTANYITYGCILLNVILFLIILFLLNRRVVAPLSRTIANLSMDSEAVGRDAEKIKHTSAQLSESAVSQADSVEKTSFALKRMTEITHDNARNADEAKRLMDEAAAKVSRGEEAVGKMTSAMSAISDSSEQIESILKTIESIAFQTNLLALNASVEAARAGEAGKGFAVVADEVKNLAQRSAQSARSTAELVTETVTNVRNGGLIAKELERSSRGSKSPPEILI